VYAAKSTDVTDVMVNGRWLMRDRTLTTIEVAGLLQASAEYARHIDAFLTAREGSLYSRLVAIGGAEQEESYEVQIKVKLENIDPVRVRLESGEFQVLRRARYHEYDTYFSFGDPAEGRLRHREDEFIDETGNVYNVRYRLTMTGPAAERAYDNSVFLSRSRFIAPASHSLRFYREYFKPERETAISKDRQRWQIRFQGEEFFVNMDRLLEPALPGAFLEIKARTWSRRDAEEKAEAIGELVRVLGLDHAPRMERDYTDLVTS
jgi:5-methylthioadenosine/S-adenosylhomocysteine deaminase